MDTLNGSTFRALRLAAGYKTLTSLARNISLPRRLVSSWDEGRYRPAWPHPVALAESFGINLVECISSIWPGENVGDPCPCGCANKKVFPKDDGARCLSIEIHCASCGATRIDRHRSRGRHRKLCPRCANTARRKKPDFYECVGSGFNCAKQHVHGRRCPRTYGNKCFGTRAIRVRNYPAKQQLSAAQQKTSAWVDETKKQFKCPPCAASARLRGQRPRGLKPFPKGRNSWGPKLVSVGENGRRARLLGRFYSEWSGRDLPNFIARLCLYCHDLNIVRTSIKRRGEVKPRAALFHGECYQTWRHTAEGKRYEALRGEASRIKGEVRGTEKKRSDDLIELRDLLVRWEKKAREGLPQLPAGLRRTEKQCLRDIAWTIQYWVGKRTGHRNSYDDLSRWSKPKVPSKTIEDRVNFIIKHLDPNKLQAQFKERFSLLMDLVSGETSRSPSSPRTATS